MLVKDAKEIARQWIFEEATQLPGFCGAFFAGSTNWKPDNAQLPVMSDVDIKVVIDSPVLPDGYRKFVFQNVLLEISYASSSEFDAPESVLTNYYLAKHFTTANVIADPSGQLTHVQEVVSKEYAKRKWVRRRCEHARDWLLTSYDWFNPADPFHDQVFEWLYPLMVTNHVVIVADLRNPTVREMFVASREVLDNYGYLSVHESILTLLGSVGMTQAQVETLLESCVDALDLARQYLTTPFWGATNITDYGRKTVAEGTREMIERGWFREAVGWILLNHTWCQKALYNDAPLEVQQKATLSYQHLLNEIGITAATDLPQRREQVRRFVPHLWKATEVILEANLAIVD